MLKTSRGGAILQTLHPFPLMPPPLPRLLRPLCRQARMLETSRDLSSSRSARFAKADEKLDNIVSDGWLREEAGAWIFIRRGRQMPGSHGWGNRDHPTQPWDGQVRGR